MHVEKVLGHGPESVYVFHFPSQGSRTADFPCKIGRAGRQGAQARIKSLQAGMQEEPVIDLILRCSDSTYLERALHTHFQDKRLATFGSEWFNTSPDDIEEAWWSLQDLPTLPLHQQFRRARALKGLTQAELANASGCQTSLVSALERGFDIPMSTAVEIARELGMTLQLSPTGRLSP